MLHSISSLFPPNLDSGMILLANYRPFFSSFVIFPPSREYKFCQVMEASVMEEITEKCFICGLSRVRDKPKNVCVRGYS